MAGRKKTILMIVIPFAVIAIGYFVYSHLMYVSTDDAQVGAHVTMLSSRVNGTIQKVMVEENQRVKAGDTLAQIDTSDYSSASTAAEAQVAALQARYREAETNYKRAVELFGSQAISKERYDNAQADYKDTGARLRASQAQLDQANLNVQYTRIVAPTDGIIARKSVEIGQFVPAGQALFGFVETNERWITANLKETELEDVVPGKKAFIKVDAIPGKTFHGEVESISPSTGSTFTLLPPDNATGNFTKVVQRVPVRIKLTSLSEDDASHLRAGLSAVVDIQVH